jgi:hypothetical protein
MTGRAKPITFMKGEKRHEMMRAAAAFEENVGVAFDRSAQPRRAPHNWSRSVHFI